MGTTARRALLILTASLAACIPRPSEGWPAIKQWVREEFPQVPVMTVPELEAVLDDPARPRPLLLDAREPSEYEISHLEGALSAPSESRALELLVGVPVEAPIVVYCSVGYRSAALAEKLATRGYGDVRNLEGSLFEWANRGLPLYRDGAPVHEVHPFDPDWGRLLERELWAADW